MEIPGSDYTIEVDTVIMALGTSPNPLISNTTEGLEVKQVEMHRGRRAQWQDHQGGRLRRRATPVTGAATVILAMEAGKAGARGIDEYLSGKEK